MGGKVKYGHRKARAWLPRTGEKGAGRRCRGPFKRGCHGGTVVGRAEVAGKRPTPSCMCSRTKREKTQLQARVSTEAGTRRLQAAAGIEKKKFRLQRFPNITWASWAVQKTGTPFQVLQRAGRLGGHRAMVKAATRTLPPVHFLAAIGRRVVGGEGGKCILVGNFQVFGYVRHRPTFELKKTYR